MPEALAVAERHARGAIAAWGRTRDLLAQSFDTSFERQLEDEAQAISRAAGEAEAAEGVQAFLDKRRPVFGSGL